MASFFVSTATLLVVMLNTKVKTANLATSLSSWQATDFGY
jgi:hypothetical protein